MFVRMLIVACVEAALALLFFMHLWENRGLKWFVLKSGILVLVVPPTLGSIGMIFVVYSKRNQVRRTEDSDESVQDW
jgi:heme/copper-type cytochrome/quinol oxidase subunit 4